MIGSVIHEQYLIQELLGEGGMGVVYKALDRELDRPVALKFLKGEFTHNQLLVKRFRDELKVLASFNHSNITTLHTSFSWQGGPVMVMELLDGETFGAMIGRRGPIPAHISVPLVLQALAGVGEAHRRGIIHRDLKPANLMLNRAGVVKVMDFGIAKMEQAPGLTRTTTVMGTPYYMAPEQVDAAQFGLTRVDYRADIYSMGVTLYELLAGEVPFSGGSEFSIQRAHLEQEPPSPTVYYPHIPLQVVDAVMRALAKDPRRRFQNAEEFAHALDFSASVASVTSQPSVFGPTPHLAQTVATADTIPTVQTSAGESAAPSLASSRLPATVLDPTCVSSTMPAQKTVPTPIPADRVETAQQTASNVTARCETAVHDNRTSAPAPTSVASVSTSNDSAVVQSQSAQPRNALLHRWFGYTGKPWLTATAVATLVLLLLAYGGFVLYASLNRTTEPQPADEARSGGGGGASTGTGNFANNGTTHHSGDKSEEFHLPRPTPVASIANIPVARPQATPNIPTQTPVHETVPKPATTGLVAGRWTGSYTSCTDGSINTANMSLSESAGTDASKLIVSGRLNIVTDSGVGNCSINGTYTKKANRLFLRAACGSKVSPEYLSATHANSLSLGGNQDQLTGVILPDSPCVTVSFTKK